MGCHAANIMFPVAREKWSIHRKVIPRQALRGGIPGDGRDVLGAMMRAFVAKIYDNIFIKLTFENPHEGPCVDLARTAGHPFGMHIVVSIVWREGEVRFCS